MYIYIYVCMNLGISVLRLFLHIVLTLPAILHFKFILLSAVIHTQTFD